MLLARGDIGASLLREAEGTELAADSGFAAPERAVEPSERLDPAASGHDAPDG